MIPIQELRNAQIEAAVKQSRVKIIQILVDTRPDCYGILGLGNDGLVYEEDWKEGVSGWKKLIGLKFYDAKGEPI